MLMVSCTVRMQSFTKPSTLSFLLLPEPHIIYFKYGLLHTMPALHVYVTMRCLTRHSDGHLCDELGNLLLDAPSPARPQRLVLEQANSDDSLDSDGKGCRPPRAHAGTAADDLRTGWWPRVLDMLLGGGLGETALGVVLQEVRSACGLPQSGTAQRLHERLPAQPRLGKTALVLALTASLLTTFLHYSSERVIPGAEQSGQLRQGLHGGV